MSQAEAGKGSAPRKQLDKAAYDSGWDRIFGNKNETDRNQSAETTKLSSTTGTGKESGKAQK